MRCFFKKVLQDVNILKHSKEICITWSVEDIYLIQSKCQTTGVTVSTCCQWKSFRCDRQMFCKCVEYCSLAEIKEKESVQTGLDDACKYERPRGQMDKVSDYGSEDSRFESWRGRLLIVSLGF